jgi:hypothetical protein
MEGIKRMIKILDGGLRKILYGGLYRHIRLNKLNGFMVVREVEENCIALVQFPGFFEYFESGRIRKTEKNIRNYEICKTLSIGKTYREVASMFNLSGSRIQQLQNKFLLQCGHPVIRNRLRRVPDDEAVGILKSKLPTITFVSVMRISNDQ